MTDQQLEDEIVAWLIDDSPVGSVRESQLNARCMLALTELHARQSRRRVTRV